MEQVKNRTVRLTQTDSVQDLITQLNNLFNDLFQRDFTVPGTLYANDALYAGSIQLKELTAEPADPDSNMCVIWLNTSGEVRIKYNDGTSVSEGVLAW